MKKLSAILLIFSVFFMAKDQEKPRKKDGLGFDITAKLGTSVLIQSDRVNVNGTVNGGDLLFYCKLNKSKFSAGIGVLNFLSDGTFQSKEYFLEHSYLRIIPLKMTHDVEVFEKWSNDHFQVLVGVGMYLNTLLEEQLETIDNKIKNKKSNWNSGVSIDLGLNFDISKHTSFSIGYQIESDISSLKKNNSNKTKLRTISTINFTLGIKL